MRPASDIGKSILKPRPAAPPGNAEAGVNLESPRRSSTARLIETHFHAGPGYEPFLVREGWQVAQLNFSPEQRATRINRVERHANTDEVFVLCRGGSIIVAAIAGAAGLRFKAVRMKPGVTYNIPAGVWHNIAMIPGDLVIIVEKDNTHRTDFEYRNFTLREQTAWARTIARLQDGSTAIKKCKSRRK
jgi:mannose-6-phosphate isomerase-like protein (cupin superfamily)